ncbi:filamentous hemagglutinin N-terminal domain-containing protein [Marinospirillum alkaliphilum]|uniref:Filamentous hemagglutinin family N-terminal domain-containing protein n=1 Tax=Marinospirillum alkaliphilum DSM 21637 TaxID=1122209 RepID=A0A1K1YTU3_9GAMM|nr:filamentous hemagglutinin N-terminal domain-containing protein [Marinospirillum alkaliphilum]SFX65350.1 filamentous hemagglutinin family N-terminal domain-containing protein [Marinospirillum alkaliphilum DSM 21637]
MNTIFRLVWNASKGMWQVTSELSSSRTRQKIRRSGHTLLAAGSLLLVSSQLFANSLPSGGQVTLGQGQINQQSGHMVIDQSSNKMAIDWQRFSIGKGNSVTFNQPGRDAVALNRVIGSDVSSIQGALNANGQIFLINPNGVVFSTTAQINVGGLVASTLNISNEDFAAGRYRFEGDSNAAIINQGQIQAGEGGYVALIAARIENTGSITASQGDVLLGAGRRVLLDMGGPVKLEIEEAAIDALIEQGGAIRADSGTVLLTAQAVGELTRTVINHTGTTEARTLSRDHGTGTIKLLGGMDHDRIDVAGRLDASAPNGGDGGFIETSAAKVQIAADVQITTRAEQGQTGTWLIDPTDFTISKGDGTQSASGIGATTLQNNLATTSVEIQTVAAGSERGNINVDADVEWDQNTLTLTAHGDILINATLTVAGSAELALNHGWNGNAASPTYGNNNSHLIVHGRVDLSETSANTLAINGQDHTILRSQSEVASMSSGLNGRYVLGGNLDFSVNWTPIGTNTTGQRFSGEFDGLGNQIRNLTVSHNASGAGLFGNTEGATLSNLRLVGVNVTNSGGGVGALVGNTTNSHIFNVHAQGSVTSTRTGAGAADAGGLVGYSVGSTIEWSSTDVAVTANNRNVGGLVGDATNHLASGRVSTIRNSFALGNVTITGAEGNVGGLVGAFRAGGVIANSYAAGVVSAQANNADLSGVGGLVGEIRTNDATVTNSYASGTVTTTGTGDPKGGLIGKNAQGDGSNVVTSYWVNGLSTSAGGTQITSNETHASSYGFSDFGSNWVMLEGYATPFLKAQGSDALMLNGQLTITQNDNLILNQNINTVSVLGSSTLTLKSQNDIVLNPGISIRSSGGKLNTVLWADSDGNEVGGVLFNPNAAVLTNGGHLWMGGGSGSTVWNGLNVGNSYAAFLNTPATLSPVITERYSGINILGSTISTGGGDLYMSGKSAQTNYRFGIGTRFNGGNTITANNITIHGIGSSNAATAGDTNRGNWGVGIENTTMNATGDIHIEGQGGGQSAGDNGGGNHGIRMDANSHLNASGAGNITLIGIGGGNSAITANTDNDGIRLDGGRLTTASGEITLQGTAGLHGSSEGVNLNSGNVNNLIQSTEGGDITIIADTLTISSNQRLASTGHLVVKPLSTSTGIGIGGAAGSLQLASSYLDTNFVNGFSNIIIGSETAGNITVGGSTTYRDNLTLKTAGDITMNASSSLTGASGEDASLVFWADADGSGAGSIYLMNGSSITTHGGHLWMGGGSGSITWNGLTVGDGYAMAGTTHHVYTDAARQLKNGITLSDATLVTAGGDVALYGKSLNQSATGMQGYVGILFSKSEISSGDGDIHISAIQEGSSTNASWNYGLLMITRQNNLTSSIASTGGNIIIIGETAFAKDTHGAGVGLYGWNNPDSLLEIRSDSGDINITGRLNSTGYDGQYGGIYFFGESQENIVSQSGNIFLNGFSANPNVAGINVHPGNSTNSIGYDGINAFTGDITLNSNTFINFEGAITANTLNLLGSGVNYTLQSTENNVRLLAANTGSVSFTNSGALELGDITTSGKMDIATQTGDLTIKGNLLSGSTASDAIILNAGRSVAAGAASDGNIIHQSGNITTGAGGRAVLYTGSVAGSSGVTDLVGSGSGNFRYNSNATTTQYTTALGSSGLYAIYREQPTVTVTARDDNKITDATPYSGGNGVDITGLVNGDAESVLTGALVYSGDSQGATEEGSYVLTPGGLSNGLGYAVAFADGTLQIIAAPPVTPPPSPPSEPETTPSEPETSAVEVPTQPLETTRTLVSQVNQPAGTLSSDQRLQLNPGGSGLDQAVMLTTQRGGEMPAGIRRVVDQRVGTMEVVEVNTRELVAEEISSADLDRILLAQARQPGQQRVFLVDGGVNAAEGGDDE